MRIILLLLAAAVVAVAPEIPFWLEPMVEIGATSNNRPEVALQAYGFRKDLTTQYFSLAVLCISLVGFTVLRFEVTDITETNRRLMISSLAASILSILLGIVQLEVLGTLLAGQVLVTEWVPSIGLLPTIQLAALAFAALSALTALLSTLRSDAIRQRPFSRPEQRDKKSK